MGTQCRAQELDAMTCPKCSRPLPELEDLLYCPFCGRKLVREYGRRRRGNGQGTARKRGSTWTGYAAGYSWVDESGKRHTVRPSKGGFRTKSDALAWAAQNNPAAQEAPIPRLVDLWTGYRDNELPKLSADKQTAYKAAARRLKPIMGRTVDSLTVDDLQAVINTVSTYYPARDIKTVLSHCYLRAMASNANRGRITQNLSEFVTLPKLEEREAAVFTSQEVKQLWTLYEAGDVFTGYILLMIYTGMMPAELLSCRRDQIDLDRCEIRGAGAKTAARKAAVIVFPPYIRPVLEDLLAVEVKNCRSTGEKLLSMNKWTFYDRFRETLSKAGIENEKGENGKYRLTPYACRHTFGTEAVRQELHPEMIKRLLRHSSTRTQEKYTHLGAKDLHAAADALPK